jgi:hypothetical protein
MQALSVTDGCRYGAVMEPTCTSSSAVAGQYCSHRKVKRRRKNLRCSASENKFRYRWNIYRLVLFARRLTREVDTMTKILLATVAILAFTAPSFGQQQQPQDRTTGQAPPSGASSFYLAQDTATMKCQVVNAQPAAGGNMKVIGAAHPTQAEAQTALAAEKACIK